MSSEAIIVAEPQPPEPPKPEDKFTPFEQTALSVYRQGKDKHTLSPSFQAQLYELYLSGTKCEDIASANPGIALGQVLEARLQYSWDERRARYIDELMTRAKPRIQQVQLEALEHLRTVLAVAHRAFGKKATKYLQTGLAKDLPSMDNAGLSFQQYRQTLELLLKLTGQTPPDRQEVSGVVTHEHVVRQQAEVQAPAPVVTTFTPQQAAIALEALENDLLAKEKSKP